MQTFSFFFLWKKNVSLKKKQQQRVVSWKSRWYWIHFMAVNTQILKVEVVVPNNVLDLRKNAGNTMKIKNKRKRRFKKNKNYRLMYITTRMWHLKCLEQRMRKEGLVNLTLTSLIKLMTDQQAKNTRVTEI